MNDTAQIDPASQAAKSCAAMFKPTRPLLPEILALHEKWLGDKLALICEGETRSWRAFGEATNKVANGLLATGLGRGDAVAVVMDNSPEMVEILFGIMKAGCVSVPLNLTISDDAMAAMCADARVRAVFASGRHIKRIQTVIDNGLSGCAILICIDGVETGWSSYDDWARKQAPFALKHIALAPDDGFNIIYSSGTTGRPKGIVHTHQTRLDWAYDLAISLRYHGGAKTLCTLSLYSNISWVMMLCTLLAGGTLIVSRKFDAGEFINNVCRHGATHTAVVPVQLRRILDHPEFDAGKVETMRAMMSCGSPLHENLKKKIFDSFPCGVIELYGLTEGVITTLDPEDAEGRMASVGKPLIGTDIKIVGDDDCEAAKGEAGEIVSCGRILMPGYLNRPDANAEAVWKDEDGSAWLRTGDIGRLDEDGFLYIVDRKKDMILSGGQNIFPADIETVVGKHPAVKGVAVVGAPHPDWGETPFAFVEATFSGVEQEILNWVNEQVGRRQRLTGLEIVDELPRNPNGKILKRELRKLFQKSAAQ